MTIQRTRANSSGRLVVLHGFRGVGRGRVSRYIAETYGFTEVRILSHLYQEVAQVLEVSQDILMSRAALKIPQDAFANFHVSDGAYRSFLSESGEDIYTPRTSMYHLKKYGVDYMDGVNPLKWMSLAMGRLVTLRGLDVVIPDMRTYRNLREYQTLRRLAVTQKMAMCVIYVHSPAVVTSGEEYDLPLPPFAVDEVVENTPGMWGATMALIDHALDSHYPNW